MDQYERVQQLLNRRLKIANYMRGERQENGYYLHKLEVKFRAEAIDAYKKAFPKKRNVDWLTIRQWSGTVEIKQRYMPQVNAIQEQYDNLDKRIVAALEKLCRDLPLRKSQTTLVACRRTAYEFSSQGPGGAEKYARVAAEIDAARYAAYGVDAKVVPDPEGKDFAVLVATDQLGLDMTKHKPSSLSFVEAVRMAWAKGANPRVFWPLLPYGFEEENGLDFFGNKVAK